MFVLMQTNPSLLAVLGRGFGALQAELERIEKLGELEVSVFQVILKVSLRPQLGSRVRIASFPQ